jgi:hypothetical protein
MHLTPEELLDLAEGTRPSSSAPHLTACEECRHHLTDLQDVMATLEMDVPEPSPLFWEHLSTRVRDAVVADAGPARSWFGLGRLSWGLAAVMSAVVVVMAISLTLRTPTSTPTPPAVANVLPTDVGSAPPADDASLSLLGDLASSLDWDAAAEAGIDMSVGTADSALTELNEGERTELRRLLREAMATSRTGA